VKTNKKNGRGAYTRIDKKKACGLAEFKSEENLILKWNLDKMMRELVCGRTQRQP